MAQHWAVTDFISMGNHGIVAVLLEAQGGLIYFTTLDGLHRPAEAAQVH